MHLQPWELLRDERSFTVEGARERIEPQAAPASLSNVSSDCTVGSYG